MSVWHSLPLSPAQLSLAHVLKSGQSFRWTHHALPTPCPPPSAPTEYSLCLPDRLILLRQSPTHLHYSAVFPPAAASTSAAGAKEETTLAWVKDYFRLEVDLEKLYEGWAEGDEVFRKEEGEGGVLSGVRVLRQDPWECLFSFICSSNNNISRISSMVQSAAVHFSPALLTHPSPVSPLEPSTTYHPFPSPVAFASPSVIPTLRELGFGYRAPFIQRTAAMLVEEHADPEAWLFELREWETDKAREELLRFLGVGRKVADCVLLMSMDKRDVIPIDVHVHQIAQRLYSFRPSSAACPGKRKSISSGEKIPMTPKLYEEVQTALRERWGEWGGWTQAVLFASDLPFVLASVREKEARPIKPTLLRTATSSTTPMSSALPTPSELVELPASFLPSTPPPEEEDVKPVVHGARAGRLAFRSAKASTTTTVMGKSRAVKVETKVEVKEEIVDLGLGGLGQEVGEGESLGERIKRRRR